MKQPWPFSDAPEYPFSGIPKSAFFSLVFSISRIYYRKIPGLFYWKNQKKSHHHRMLFSQNPPPIPL